MTGPARPHIGNLRKRAKALGLVITRTTTAQDAYEWGQHHYVLHRPSAYWEKMHDCTLEGIEHELRELEKRT